MRTSALVALAALAGVALVACTPAVSEAPSADLPSATSSAEPPSAAPTTAPSAPPSGSAAADAGWIEATRFAADDPEWLVAGDVVHGRAGYLALGAVLIGQEGGPRLTGWPIWHSRDGRTWAEVLDPADDVFIRALTTTPDGDYVLYFDDALDPGAPPAALRSPDGIDWTEFATGLPQGASIGGIEVGAMGYLLVGDQTAEADPTLWLSADGVSWELVHEFAQDTEWVQLSDAGAGDEGFVVFGRRIDPDDSSYRRFAFASGDGRSWVETPQPLGPDDQAYVPDVVVEGIGPDWVAVIASLDDSVRTWRSADGIAWREAATIPDAGTTTAWDAVLEETSDGLYLSASGDSLWMPAGGAGAWHSPDGTDWRPLDLGADVVLGGVAEGPDAMVIAGTVPRGQLPSEVGFWVRAR